MFKGSFTLWAGIFGTLSSLIVWLTTSQLDIVLRILLPIGALIITLIIIFVRKIVTLKGNVKYLEIRLKELKSKLIETENSSKYWVASSKNNLMQLNLYKAEWHYLGVVIAATRPTVNKDKLDYIFNFHRQCTAELIGKEGNEDEQ